MTYKQLEYFEAWLKWRVAEAIGFFDISIAPDAATMTLRLTKYPDISYDPQIGWIVDCSVEQMRDAPTGPPIDAMNVFPVTLPMPEQANYSISRPTHITRSTVLNGIAAERNRDPDSVGIVTMKWILGADEYVIWDDFVHNKLFGGLAPFKGWFTNGRGAKPDQIIQFIESPRVTTNGALYEISVKAQTMLIPVMTYLEFIGSNNINEAEQIVFADSGSVNKIVYHDGSYAEFDYTNDVIITF
jgi:hypothetical protein